MNNKKMYSLILSSLLILESSMTGFAQKTHGFNNKIPESILTPDRVKTPIGDLNFFDGMPDVELVK